jgi:hypothetical protein
MTQEKLKGIVKIVTLQKILDAAVETDRNAETKEITYWNGKHLFVARRKNVGYWNIFQVKGI